MTHSTATTTQNYLRHLPLIALASLFIAPLLSFHFYIKTSDYDINANPLLRYAQVYTFMLSIAIFWVLIGYMTKHFKVAILALVLHFFIISIPILLMSFFKVEKISPYLRLFLLLIHYLPAFIFSYTLLSKTQKRYIVLLTLLMGYTPFNLLSQSTIFRGLGLRNLQDIIEFNYELNSNINIVFNIIDTFYLFFINIARIVAILAIIESAKKFSFDFKDKFLNLANTYRKFTAFIVFFSLKILLICLPFAIVQIAAIRIQDFSESHDYLQFSIIILYLLLDLMMLYGFLNFYRKFVLETLYAYGITPSVAFWLFLIPIIGTLVFLIILATNSLVSIEKRVTLLLNSVTNNSRNTILTIIISFQVLVMLITAIDERTMIPLLSGVLSCVLFVIYTQREKVIYFIVGIFVVGTVAITMLDLRDSSMLVLKQLYNIVLLYTTMSAIFHIEHFEYLPTLEDEDDNSNDGFSLDSVEKLA